MGERFRRGLTDGFHVGYGQFVTHADWTTFTSALGFGDDHSESAATPAEMLPYVTEAFTKAHEHRECERMAEEESCRVGECDHDEHPPPAVPDPMVEALSEAEREALCICPWDTSPPLPESTHTSQCSQHRVAVERILAARAAAPDALTPTTLAEALHEHRTREADPGYRFPLDRQPSDYRKRIEAEAANLWPAVQALINGTVGDTYDRRD